MALRGTLTHRKTRRLAKLLGTSPPCALGVLEALWHVTAEQQPDGGIGRMPNQDIADEMFWEDDADDLIEALEKSGWLEAREDCGYYVHDWHEHADSYVHAHLAKRTKCFASGHVPNVPHEAFNSDTRRRIIAELSAKYPDAPNVCPGQVPDKSGQVPPIPVPVPVPVPEPVIVTPPLPPKGESFAGVECPEGLVESAKRWREYRKSAKHKPWAPVTWESVFTKYRGDPILFARAVAHSIDNGYQGLFEPNTHPGKSLGLHDQYSGAKAILEANHA